ncbi:hypothetical protein MASR2M8_14200 [Opitutaceae bacterium]
MGKTGKAMGETLIESSGGVSRADLNKKSKVLGRLLSMPLDLPKRRAVPPVDSSGEVVLYFVVSTGRRVTLDEARKEVGGLHRKLSKAGFKVRWTELGGAS